MKKLLSKDSLNVAKVSSGTIIGQLITIVSLPFITRIYGAEIIGIWATIYAIAIIITTVSDIGLTQSLMIDKDENVEETYQVISFLAISISCISAFFVFLYCKFLVCYSLAFTLIIVGFTIIYAITYQQVQINYTMLSRDGNYNILMKNTIINQGIAALVSIALGVLGFKAYGYFIGMTAGQLLTLLHMKRHVPYKIKFSRISQIKKVITRHKHFVKYQTTVNVTMQARDQVPNLLIGALFGNEILGFYSISQKLLNIPITFVGFALGRVFYQRCAEMKRLGQEISRFFYRNLKRALLIAAIPMVIIGAYGDAAITMFFGSDYGVAGIIVRIVVFRAFFAFVSAATRSIDIILDKQQYAMISTFAQTIIVSLCVWLSYEISGDIIICVTLTTIAFIIIQITYFCVMFNVMHISPFKYLKNAMPTLALVAIAALAFRHLFIFIANSTQWGALVYLKQFMVMTAI